MVENVVSHQLTQFVINGEPHQQEYMGNAKSMASKNVYGLTYDQCVCRRALEVQIHDYDPLKQTRVQLNALREEFWDIALYYRGKQEFIDEDIIRQKALMELAVQFENASATKNDFRKAYEKCYDITHESRTLIDTFLKQESNKDYDMYLALYRKAAKIKNQI
nr:hypothetical protein [Tanacetum cinerariifolium]